MSKIKKYVFIYSFGKKTFYEINKYYNKLGELIDYAN